MRAALALLLVLPSAAAAALPTGVKKGEPPEITAQSVPCLRVKREESYVVRWVIVDKRTGERRNPGSQEVRQRC